MDLAMLQAFELGVDRKGTHCEKWDDCKQVFGREDVLPLWVADMDFRTAQPIVDALTERAKNGVFGYTIHDAASDQAVVDWMKTRHGLTIRPEWVLGSPGVVGSMLYGLRALTKPGDAVAIQTPVYGPFYRMAAQAGLSVYRNPLRQTQRGWEMDLDQLEDGFKRGVRALMLCSPHNPVGRVWTPGELGQLVSLCNRYGVGILSDEIHMDFEMPGQRHTPILCVPGAERAILLASATKTFNLAALRQSSIIVADEALRAKIRGILADAGMMDSNLFGQLAQDVAYREGGPWLDALIEHIDGSRELACHFLRERLPEVVPSELQGTYLMWLDFRALGLSQQALIRLLVDEAGVGLNDGTSFGPEGEGFMRMNLATPRRNVHQALSQIERALRAR